MDWIFRERRWNASFLNPRMSFKPARRSYPRFQFNDLLRRVGASLLLTQRRR